MRFISVILLIIMGTFLVKGQEVSTSTIDQFDEAQYFFNRNDYEEAAYYYRLIVEKYPENANFNFKLGECYMNIPGSEVRAIPHFEIAVKHTVQRSKYHQKDFNETNAPLHAWYYLGNVYRMDNRLDDALNAYQTFVNSPFYYGNYNVNIVENEIKSCERAKIILDSPVSISESPLDTIINTGASEINPVVSADQQFIVFVRRLKFYDAVFIATKKGDSWNPPTNLNPIIGSDGDFYPVFVSNEAKEIYFTRIINDNGDIYVSYREGNTWSVAKPLNRNINSRKNESRVYVSSDGLTMWFSSDRKRGRGGLDIYVSIKNEKGEWSRARNAGSRINTEFDEDCPFLVNNDKTLYFSSKGHYSMGGYDIFYSEYEDNSWQEPVNVGYPVNDTNDNLGFIPVNNGQSGYISKINDATEDIFRITFK